MSTILYLSNQIVQAVEAVHKGKTLTIQNVWQREAPADSMINGIVTDEEAFLPFIRSFFHDNRIPAKEVSLVINSSQFSHKVLSFPRLPGSELQKLIVREFAENRTENTLFTYDLLEEGEKNSMRRVLACAVEKAYLLSYVELFKKAGVTLTAIDSQITALVRLFQSSPEIGGKTCLIQVLDGQEVMSLLFVKGVYYYSQKNRLFSQDPIDGLAEELSSIQGKLRQFLSSQQTGESIETIYICGQGQEQLRTELEDVRVYTGDKILTRGKMVRRRSVEFFYPAGILLGSSEGGSIFRQLKREQKKEQKKRKMFLLLAPSLAVILLGLIVTAVLFHTYRTKNAQLDDLHASMEQTEAAGRNTAYEMSMTKVDTMRSEMREAEDFWDKLMSYPVLSTAISEKIVAHAGSDVTATVRSFQRDSGVLSLEAEAKDVRAISTFVASLQEDELFASVEYSGYTYAESTDLYTIHVVCCLAEGAGRQEDGR